VVRVAPGQRAYFTILGDPEKRYEGRLRAIEPAPYDFADGSSIGVAAAAKGAKTPSAAIFYQALFDVPNPEHRLRIAMTAQVSIVLDTASRALSIPVSALGEKAADGAYAVRVLGSPRRVETRNVRIGINNNVRAEVVSGLHEGERVIIGDAAPGDEAAGAAGV
jgi:membrane fusion protein, macrolide-specific efflux system